MSYVPSSSREHYVNPKTLGHTRAVFAKLLQTIRNTDLDLSSITEDLTSILEATLRLAIADEQILQGELVYLASEDHIALADASDGTAFRAAGMAFEDIPQDGEGLYVPFGVVTKEAWGLTPNAQYYLSASVPGEMNTAPTTTTVGHYVVPAGRALSADDFLVDIGTIVKL